MNIQNEINNLLGEVQQLDKYTQMSVLGSFQFALNASCINQAMKFVPETPDETPGIEGYTPYEQARRKFMQDSEESYLPALIAIRREVEGMLNEIEGNGSIARTFEYMTSTLPTRKQFEAEYENRRRNGMRPSISLKQFVDNEYAVAMKRHAALVAKGDDAIRLCETIDVSDERGYGDLPDWVLDSLYRKIIDKANLRWQKLEMDRCNPRLMKQRRDSAAADQLFIERMLEKLGEPIQNLTPIQAIESIKPDMPFDDPIPFGAAA